MMQSVSTLFSEMVDYAGLFPPARLDMKTTVANYDEYVRSDHAWMLGRLIVPLSRLDEFEAAALRLLPTSEEETPWIISALLPPIGEFDFEEAMERVFRFNEAHQTPARGAALIDTIELKASTPHMIDDTVEDIPEGLAAYFEISSKGDPRGMIAALAGTPGRAKVRTGGVEPEMIPLTRDLVDFIIACGAADVAFKATAGLHHPVRAVHPLTYEPHSERALMHGFINVFFGASAVRCRRADEATLADIIDEQDAEAFVFDDEGVQWRDVRLEHERLALGREEFCVSFGSCSFEEPVDDLISLNLI